MSMEMNSEITPTEIVYFCDTCDLEFDHDGSCEWDSDDDDDDFGREPIESDVWADSNALASAGWGTDEDYGFYGDDY